MLSLRWIAISICTAAMFPMFAGAQISAAPAPPAPAASAPMPPNYGGVGTHVPGIWVTPVPNAPFSATVQIVSHNRLPDGTDHVVTTTNHIARSSSGRIYNERRRLMPNTFKGEPKLVSAHIFDPTTRLNIYTDPRMHIAREFTQPSPPRTPANLLPPSKRPATPGATETDLGVQNVDGVPLHGYRRSRTVQAEVSGTGKPVVINDDYWYSEALSIYMIIRHDDPRTGEQLIAVTDVERAEPPAELFAVPAHYKVVDETPPEPFE